MWGREGKEEGVEKEGSEKEQFSTGPWDLACMRIRVARGKNNLKNFFKKIST